jgi:hypothetical protein
MHESEELFSAERAGKDGREHRNKKMAGEKEKLRVSSATTGKDAWGSVRMLRVNSQLLNTKET